MTTTFKWNEENTAKAEQLAATITSYEGLGAAAEEVGTSVRSLASKLRSLGYDVPKKTSTATFTQEQSAALAKFVTGNVGKYTYSEVAANFEDGVFNSKQIQGKLLALELTACVKATVHEKNNKYTREQEAKIVEMVNNGSNIEAIATSVGAEVKSLRGKLLSLLKSGVIDAIPASINPPKQSTKEDSFAGIEVENMTVAQLSEVTGKTERGIKAMITRRGISCADYTPKAKKEVALQEAA